MDFLFAKMLKRYLGQKLVVRVIKLVLEIASYCKQIKITHSANFFLLLKTYF